MLYVSQNISSDIFLTWVQYKILTPLISTDAQIIYAPTHCVTSRQLLDESRAPNLRRHSSRKSFYALRQRHVYNELKTKRQTVVHINTKDIGYELTTGNEKQKQLTLQDRFVSTLAVSRPTITTTVTSHLVNQNTHRLLHVKVTRIAWI